MKTRPIEAEQLFRKAAASNDVAAITQLKKANPDLNIDAVDEETGQTAFHYAARTTRKAYDVKKTLKDLFLEYYFL